MQRRGRTRDELRVRRPRERGRSSVRRKGRLDADDGRRRRRIERHSLHQLVEAWLVAERVDHRMHAEIGSPPTTLIDRALDPVERSLLVANTDVGDGEIDWRDIVSLESFLELTHEAFGVRFVASQRERVRERRPRGVRRPWRERQSLAQYALRRLILLLQG